MPSENKMTRRSFVAGAPVAGAAFAGSAALGAVARASEGTSAGDVFRVGCLNVSSYSHLEAIWAPMINPRPGTGDIPLTGMRITHCWEIDPERGEQFAKTFGCEAVKNFDDMVGKVDGIISGGYFNHPWNHVLHEPYLEAGLPNLINRPLSNSRAKAQQIVETARKHGATILTPSAFEHNDAIARAKAWATGKNIICYTATNSFDDYPTHGIHGVYLIYRAIVEAGNPVVSVAFRADRWYSPPGVMTFEHRAADGRQFFGALHQAPVGLGSVHIHTGEEPQGRSFQIQGGMGSPYDRTEMWAPTIWVFQNMAMHGEMPQTFDQLLEKNNLFLAGWRSILENDGGPVAPADVPEDWESPVELPTRADDPTVALFRKKFG